MLLFLGFGCVKQPLVDSAALDSGGVMAPEIGPCGAWSGVRRVGTTWTVQATQAYKDRLGWDGGGTQTVIADSAEETVIHYVAHFEGGDSWFDVDRTETWRCDADGAWWVRSDVKTSGRTYNADIGVIATRTFEPGWLVRPSSLHAGATWQDAFVVTTVSEDVGDSTSSVTCTTTAGQEVEHPVAAGTLKAVPLTVDCGSFGAPQPWLAEGTGFVDDGDVELSAYVP
jgi:hypothetical protein